MSKEQELPTVLLSAGHNPGDTGARFEDYNEHDIVRGISWYLMGEMSKERGVIVPVVAVPTGRLVSKIAWVNEYYGPEICSRKVFAVEVHVNSSSNSTARGVSVFTHKSNYMTRQMGSAVLTAVARPSWPSRGMKTQADSNLGSLGWVSQTTMPAMLIEIGFITNRAQRMFMVTDAGQHSLAIRLADGLVNAAIFMNSYLNKDKPGGKGMTRGTYNKAQWKSGEARGTLNEGDTHVTGGGGD